MSNFLKLELGLEQQFALNNFTKAARKLPREQLEKYLIEVIRQGMAKDNVIKQLMKES